MIGASLDLYETTGQYQWLQSATELQTAQNARYLDPRDGGYYLTSNDGEALLVREKPAYDRAVPSGNSVAALNLLRLHDLSGDEAWRKQAERLFAMLSLRVTRAPTGFPLLLTALDRYYDLPLEVAIVAPSSRREADPLTELLRVSFVPNKTFAVLTELEASRQARHVPWLEAKRSIGGKPTAYVCQRGSCELPTSKPAVFQKQLGRVKPYPSFAG
jgi:uncharacterized protein YyaL (SSP411 family)